jgi:3-hydroxyacyl-CoA dehydrogenase / enoyl-CoA hydratase / 3-hydroxybutyryl-CoA epimerase
MRDRPLQHIKLSVADDGIALVTLNHATESMNLVSPQWIDEFNGVIDRIAGDASVRGAIITSGKPTFMAGADLKVMVTAFGNMTHKQAALMSQEANAMHRRIETCGKPFVAAINGVALGGGFELCLACHERVIVEDPDAIVGLPEVKVGLLPGSGGTQRLPRMIGVARALPLLLEGTSLRPGDALGLGLVDQVVQRAQLICAARARLLAGIDPVRPWDKKGFSLPESVGLINYQVAAFYSLQAGAIDARHGENYPAPVAILSAVFEGVQLPFDRALIVESRYFATLLAGPVARNIIRTSFLSKGAAEKLTGRPKEIPKATFTRVGVLGAGMMGAGIAHVVAAAGIEVMLLDMTVEAAEKGKAYSQKILAKEVARGKRTQASADAILDRIRPTISYADLAGCGLVVEAVFEDVAIKAQVTAKAEPVLAQDAVFSSNTSTLPITQLAQASVRPDRFIGLHFFSPVERMALVEVIVGKATSRETVARSLDFVAQLRKAPIIINDSRGFYTSRVFQTYIHEGAAMLADGIAPALIENAAREAGFAIGPLALLDEVTVDLPLKIVEQALQDGGPGYEPPCGTPVLERMRDELKRHGRKAGGGFYEYPSGAPKRLWHGLKVAFPPAATQPAADELKTRFLAVQAIEAARCLEEGVLLSAADADLGSVLGWSFPSWTGGTLSYIDTLGIKPFVTECERLARIYGPRFLPSTWLLARAQRDEVFYPAARAG